jgi:ribosomal protein S18 acetylase RimI-like enzyme
MLRMSHHSRLNSYYRVSGLAVDARYPRQGLGLVLMHRLMNDVKLITESSAELRLGVDADKPRATTEWLRQWYSRLGFAELKEVPSLSLSSLSSSTDEILMHKQSLR